MDDFGGNLRQARERRGISLRQIAATTKISASALDALERNDISRLPGGIFSRAFVRSYAVEVGLDPDETVREFLERFTQDSSPSAEPPAVAIPETERTYQEEQRKAVRALAIIGAALLMLAVGGIFLFRARAARNAARGETAASSAKASPVLEAAPVLPPAPALQRAAETPGPGAAVQPQPADVAGVSRAPVITSEALQLDIHPSADCWVSMTVDGTKLFARMMKAGEHETHAVQREAVVEIGDAGAFAFSINGRAGKALGDAGQVKTLKLTPATAAQYLR
jgi:cytoskeletal protein RodZ